MHYVSAVSGAVPLDLESRKDLPLFPIGIVEKLTGLSARQVRYYEQHGLVHPTRSEGNQRLFSFHDVERLLQVRALLDDGLNMEGVKRRLTRDTKAERAVADLTDGQVHEHIRKELMTGAWKGGTSEFRGDLFRFYRKR